MRAVTLIFEYRCAVCWGVLTEHDGNIECYRYTEHKGYHRLSGIEWQRAHSEQELSEVVRLYQDLPPWSYILGLAKPPDKIGVEQLKRNKLALGRDDSWL
ncbi:MAG TPA: hypothetical protein VII92_01715 [Anaerolineae bacterium]